MMPATSTCKPWCTDHQNPNECLTKTTIWDNGEEEKAEYEEGSVAAQFQALGLPKDVAWINLTVSQDEDDEQPLADLQLFEAGNYEAVAAVHLGYDGLKELYSNLTTVMKEHLQ
ncbi:hypothetical protein [Arthrobacter sp. NPDC092385]|uniref:hypothetical protein n=1 Tax=Arthrobacter sp. NPDC092385 TaxID=3363943 RepID=UPI00380F738D